MSSDEHEPTAEQRFAEGVLALAQEYERALAEARRKDAPPTIRERLNEAGTVRRAWKALEPELPALFAEADATGRFGAEGIAVIVGVSTSYVYRCLREHRAQ
jgi:hypothetical protein